MNAVVWLAIAGLAVTGCTALGAKSLRRFSRHELAEICRRRSAPGLLNEILLRHERVALAVECLQTLATTLYIAAGCYWLIAGGQATSTLERTIWAVVGAAVLLLTKLWLPDTLARLWAEPFLYATWRLWRGVAVLLVPLVQCARFVDAVAHRLAGREPQVATEETIEDEIRTILSEGHREGLLEEDAREMIEGVIELGDADVAHVMTPRTEIVTMPAISTLHEGLELIITSGHTRIPVFDKNRDDIVGILYAKDLLPELAKDPQERIDRVAKLAREPYFVPETKPVDALLEEFQHTRNHMAVVLDEYGGVSGLVTIEDVLEEIVGEIVDEYDPDLVEEVRRIDEVTTEVLARVHVDELNEELGTEIPEQGDFDTIGGYVFTALGRVPTVGDTLEADNVRITVMEVSKRRIERLRIEILDRVQRRPA